MASNKEQRGPGCPTVSDSTYEKDTGGHEHTASVLNGSRSVPPGKDGFSDMSVMVPTIVCVFLGTVLLMIILYVIMRCCRRGTCYRDNNVNDDVTSQQTPVNPHPPPYHALSCNGNPSRDCHVFHSRCDMCIHQYQTRTLMNTAGLAHSPLEHGLRENEFPLAREHMQYPLIDTGTVNPIFNEDESRASIASSDVDDSVDSGMSIRDLYKLTDRSITQTIDGKLVVSVTHLVDHQGAVLILDNMGISLKVPPGAVKRGNKQIIFLVLNWDLSDNPAMKEDESLVSPVVYVGPHGLKLQKPCTLAFRHCSYNTRQIRVMRSETELTVQKDWKVLHDQNDVTSSCYMTSDECQLKIDTFTLYTCVQAPMENQVGKKWLQIAAFACPLRKDINHHQIRLYFLNKTPCALQWAIQNEASFGGKMICPEKVFLFDGSALDMFTKSRYVSDQWDMVEQCGVDKISFLKIWHGQCPHISICYRRHDALQTSPSNTSVTIEMNVHLFTYQNSRENDGEKIVIQICEDNVTPATDQEAVCSRHHIGEIVIDINPDTPLCPSPSTSRQGHCDQSSQGQGHGDVHIHRTNDGGRIAEGQYSTSQVQGHTSSQDSESGYPPRFDSSEDGRSTHDRGKGSESSLKVVVRTNQGTKRDDRFDVCNGSAIRVIPHALRKELKILLDANHMFGSDWRDLAGKVGLDKCIPVLRHVESPTEKILDFVEQHRITLQQLQDIFKDIEREDCAIEVEKYIEVETHRKLPTENGDSSVFREQGNVTGYTRRPSASMSYRSLQEQSFCYSNREDLSSTWNVADNSNWVLNPQMTPLENDNT